MSARTASKPIREKLYVQVMEQDRSPAFVDVSSSVGRVVEFTKPVASAALQVNPDSVLVSCLKLSAKSRTAFSSRPLSWPVGPVARLSRWLDNVDELGEGQLLMHLDQLDAAFTVRVDDAGIASLDTADGTEDTLIELPRQALNVSLAMAGPRGRPLGVAWTGYLNKPGTPETVTRIAAQVLNHVSGLAPFQALTGISTVRVPAPTGRFVLATTRGPAGNVTVTVPVQLWPADGGESVGGGTVEVAVDLEDANATTNSILLHLTPSPGLAEAFTPYRSVFEHLVTGEILNQYGADEVEDLVCDIVLGELSSGQLERLKEATSRLALGVQLSPRQGLLNVSMSSTAGQSPQ